MLLTHEICNVQGTDSLCEDSHLQRQTEYTKAKMAEGRKEMKANIDEGEDA
jgi:hypothetical protein